MNEMEFCSPQKFDKISRGAAALAIAVAFFMLGGCETLETLDRNLQEAFSHALPGRSCPGEGLRLCIQEGSTEPTEVTPGGTVEARLVYTLAGTDDPVDVVEERVLVQGGQQIARLQKETATRSAGTWETKLAFKVPSRAKEGEYEVSQRITTGGVSRQQSWYFKVRKPH